VLAGISFGGGVAVGMANDGQPGVTNDPLANIDVLALFDPVAPYLPNAPTVTGATAYNVPYYPPPVPTGNYFTDPYSLFTLPTTANHVVKHAYDWHLPYANEYYSSSLHNTAATGYLANPTQGGLRPDGTQNWRDYDTIGTDHTSQIYVTSVAVQMANEMGALVWSV
jgi:hypothetical protein